MAKRAMASFSPRTAARMCLCISARSNAPGCTVLTRAKRSLSRLLPIEGPANLRQTICKPLDLSVANHIALTTDVLAGRYDRCPLERTSQKSVECTQSEIQHIRVNGEQFSACRPKQDKIDGGVPTRP